MCIENGLTIKQLAEKCGINPSTIYSIKETSSPQIGTIEALCDGLRVDLGRFFSPEDTSYNHLSNDEMIVIEEMRQMKPDRRDEFIEYVKFLRAKKDKK